MVLRQLLKLASWLVHLRASVAPIPTILTLIGTSLEMHQNLRANVGRLFFAGEATSAEYYGFLHGL